MLLTCRFVVRYVMQFRSWFVLTKTRNEPKLPKTTQNESKPAETSRKKTPKRPTTTQNFKIGKILIFCSSFCFPNIERKFQIWAFWAKKYQFYNLKEILPLLYFENLSFVIAKFRFQIPRSGHWRVKSINFLILRNFFSRNPIFKVLISNLRLVFEDYEPKCPNLVILG